MISIVNALKDNNTITTLDLCTLDLVPLAYNNIHSDGAKQMALVLEDNQTLVRLDLGNPRFLKSRLQPH